MQAIKAKKFNMSAGMSAGQMSSLRQMYIIVKEIPAPAKKPNVPILIISP